MNPKDFEEIVYEYAHIMYKLGRAETDEKTGMKEYKKLASRKEELLETLKEHFKTNSRISKTLNIP